MDDESAPCRELDRRGEAAAGDGSEHGVPPRPFGLGEPHHDLSIRTNIDIDARAGGDRGELRQLHSEVVDDAAPLGHHLAVVHAELGRERGPRDQGLTFVHFSAQPEPFLTQNTP
jgi:hypothetical protein